MALTHKNSQAIVGFALLRLPQAHALIHPHPRIHEHLPYFAVCRIFISFRSGLLVFSAPDGDLHVPTLGTGFVH